MIGFSKIILSMSYVVHRSVKFKRSAVIRKFIYTRTYIRIHEYEYVWDEETGKKEGKN